MIQPNELLQKHLYYNGYWMYFSLNLKKNLGQITKYGNFYVSLQQQTAFTA